MNEEKFTSEDNYWRERHGQQPYASKEFSYEHYAPAYRTGVEAFGKYEGRTFEDVEDDIAQDYEKNRAGMGLPVGPRSTCRARGLGKAEQ
jgi:hypothetical protein